MRSLPFSTDSNKDPENMPDNRNPVQREGVQPGSGAVTGSSDRSAENRHRADGQSKGRTDSGAGNGNAKNVKRESVQPKRPAWIFAFLAVALLVLMTVSACMGSSGLSFRESLGVLFGGPSDSAAWQIIYAIRLPRIAAAALLGGALSVSGFLLQTFFNNPIAGPFVLGVSSGAKLTVALFLVFVLRLGMVPGSIGMILAAFAGSLLAMGFVLAVSGRIERRSVLIICGILIGYICSAVTDFVVTFADDSNIVNLHNWSQGSFSGTSWENVNAMVFVVGIGTVCAFLLSKPMSAWQLGEGYARNMGVPVARFRAELILLSSILSACVTAFAGPISFVGVAVPQLVKRMLGSTRPILMVCGCFLGGGAFCVFCDLLARTLFAPSEVSISSVTAFFGAPVVIHMMLRRNEGQEPWRHK